MTTIEKLRVEFKEKIGLSNWDFTILNKYSEWLENKIANQPTVSENEIMTEIMNNGMAGVFDEDGVVLCYDVNANMAAQAIIKLLKDKGVIS